MSIDRVQELRDPKAEYHMRSLSRDRANEESTPFTTDSKNIAQLTLTDISCIWLCGCLGLSVNDCNGEDEEIAVSISSG